MKKLTIVSGVQGSGKTTYIRNLYKTLPKGWTTYSSTDPIVGINKTTSFDTPVKWDLFSPGMRVIFDDCRITPSNIVDLLFAPGSYMWNGTKYCFSYIVATQSPRSEFPEALLNHPQVEFIEMCGCDTFRNKSIESILNNSKP